jgi:hypothetical protein
MEEEDHRRGGVVGAVGCVADCAVVGQGEGEGFIGCECEFGGIGRDGRDIRGGFGGEHFGVGT